MARIDLRWKDLVAALDPATGKLHFERAGERLPWEVNLGGFSARVRAKGAAGEELHPVALESLERKRLGGSEVQWIGEVAGAGVALNAALDAEGLAVTLTPTGTGDAEILSGAALSVLTFTADEREACWGSYQQGFLFRADGKPWVKFLEWRHVSMRVFGFTADGRSLAVIVETPFDLEAKIEDAPATRTMRADLVIDPSLGTLAYARRIRFVPLEETGHVAVANAYRSYAQKHGLWKSFDERVEENPEVEKLRGAFVACAGYYFDDGADQVAAMKAMRAMGFTRAWLFSPKLFAFGGGWNTSLGAEYNHLTDAQIAEIQSLGYLCSPFLQVEEAGPAIGLDKFAVDEKGEKTKRWQIGEEIFYEIAKWRVPAMLAQLDEHLVESKGIHFDTLTAAKLIEHRGERPYDAASDARLRNEIADYYRKRGKVICSESMRDWANLRQDLATSKTFAPFSEVDEREWTVPLTDLVYHDATPRSHWEHHSYNDGRCVHSLVHRRFHPFAMELMDLLTASPPVLFPEGMLYEFAHREVTLPSGRRELEIIWSDAKLYRTRLKDPATQAALPKALRVCKLNERHGVSRMAAHRFLGAGPMVQESEFASGLRVTVNFSDDPYPLPAGRTVPARGSMVEE